MEVYYHEGKHECDFIIKHGLKATEAIQVCWTLDNNNLRRELDGLEEAMTSFQIPRGIILAHTIESEIPSGNENISIIPVWKWLS